MYPLKLAYYIKKTHKSKLLGLYYIRCCILSHGVRTGCPVHPCYPRREQQSPARGYVRTDYHAARGIPRPAAASYPELSDGTAVTPTKINLQHLSVDITPQQHVCSPSQTHRGRDGQGNGHLRWPAGVLGI